MANESIRAGEIIPENNKINTTDLFKNTLNNYLKKLQIMDREMQKNSFNGTVTVYRNIHIDIYSSLNVGDEKLHEHFISCFTDKFNSYYGAVQVKIIVHQETPYLFYDENVIILPVGDYKLLEKTDQYYTIELVESYAMFKPV